MSADGVSAVAATVAAIVSIVAVAAAFRSASAAEQSAAAASSALHRSAIRELILLCHEVLAEDLRLHSIALSMRSEIADLSVYAGMAGGSAQVGLETSVNNYLAAASDLVKEAQAISDDHSKIQQASAQDLDQVAIRVSSSLFKIRSIRESVQDMLNEARKMSQAGRTKEA